MKLFRTNKLAKNQKGFTLLEMLLVVAIIVILASITILAINPTKNLQETRNAQRRVDTETILSAVYQYAIDNNVTPASITAVNTAVCATGGVCTGLTDLTVLTTAGKYLPALPKDPSTSTANSTNYTISKSAATNRITVNAPGAEAGVVISVTR
jgi:prepilin-type N-terminal cleavage/methylation domain-containing protein